MILFNIHTYFNTMRMLPTWYFTKEVFYFKQRQWIIYELVRINVYFLKARLALGNTISFTLNNDMPSLLAHKFSWNINCNEHDFLCNFLLSFTLYSTGLDFSFVALYHVFKTLFDVSRAVFVPGCIKCRAQMKWLKSFNTHS